jgi:lysyl-tRNA synthetase, class II
MRQPNNESAEQRCPRRLRPHVDRHALGPRIYVLGVRLHEWHLGVAIFLALGVGIATGIVHDTLPTVLAGAAGLWLVAKDWRDISPARRDTGAWRLGLHKPPPPLRRLRRAEPLPTLAAIAAVVFGVVNLLSALTPNIAWRGHLLLQVEPVAELHVLHALAVPASIGLLVSSYYLYRRRLRAAHLAIALLIVLAVLNMLKGLDFEEALGDVFVAGILFAGRRSFYVHHDPLSPRAAIARAPFVALAGFLVALTLVAAVTQAAAGTDLRETWDLLLWQKGPLPLTDEAGHLGLAVGLIGTLTLAVVAYLVFRPFTAPRDLPDPEVRRAATELVHRHGTDTLAYFKLRRDKHYLFSDDGNAFLGYRIESGVLVVSGDPVGRPEALPSLLAKLGAFTEVRGLRLAALGVSGDVRPLFEQLGLRALYLGDEAVVETASFSTEGRAIRKVRQSVNRLETAGYTSDLVEVRALDETTFAAMERVSSAWRGDRPERGFSMALDAIHREDQKDTLVLIARDQNGRLRGFLHFVPAYGRSAMSLSLMRREPDTPNGLTEFMVVKAIAGLRARGIAEMSLNFAAFARFLHSPRGRAEMLAGRLALRADAVFQIERLYRFNAKFSPRWEPRYAMYESILSLPRVALAALWLEGQLPKPSLARRRQPSRNP